MQEVNYCIIFSIGIWVIITDLIEKDWWGNNEESFCQIWSIFLIKIVTWKTKKHISNSNLAKLITIWRQVRKRISKKVFRVNINDL